MDQALNGSGCLVGVATALRDQLDPDRRGNPYRCWECRTLLRFRNGGRRQYFAHRPGVAPKCKQRSDADSAAEGVPTGDEERDLEEIGESLVDLFLREMAIERVPNTHPLLHSEETTHAQLLVVFFARYLWQPAMLPPDQITAANVLGMLGSADFSVCLRKILAARLAAGFERNSLPWLPYILQRTALRIRWESQFPGASEPRLILPEWQLVPPEQLISYDLNYHLFGRHSTGSFRDLENVSGLNFAPHGPAVRNLELARLSWRGQTPVFLIASGKELIGSTYRIPPHETVIIHKYATLPAKLYASADLDTVRSAAVQVLDGVGPHG